MTIKEKLVSIYKEMANKELTFGCKIITNEYNGDEFRISTSDSLAVKEGESYRTVGCNCCSEDLTIKEIIGHPLMIGDVIYYIRKKYWNNHSWFHSDRSKLVDLWSKEREPIEGQYDECIDFVYSLIPKRVLDSILKE